MTGNLPIEKQHWPRNSAGHKMIENVPVVPETFSVDEVSAFLASNIKTLSTIDYIYAVDENKKLKGVLSIKDLYREPHHVKIGSAVKHEVLLSVLPTADQEEAAALTIKHGIKAVPVLDENGIFLGVIQHDAIISIINKELREDILQMAGIHRAHAEVDNIMDISLLSSLKHRLPWLLLGLSGGMLAAEVIRSFEVTLEKNILIAAFIPLVVYIADAVGTQLEAFSIRDFALFRKLDFFSYFMKQLSVVSIMALILSVVLGAVSYAFYGDAAISVILSAALIGAILSSLISGLFVPYLFRKLKSDPANASGPIGTVLQDILSVFIYFMVASFML